MTTGNTARGYTEARYSRTQEDQCSWNLYQVSSFFFVPRGHFERIVSYVDTKGP